MPVELLGRMGLNPSNPSCSQIPASISAQDCLAFFMSTIQTETRSNAGYVLWNMPQLVGQCS